MQLMSFAEESESSDQNNQSSPLNNLRVPSEDQTYDEPEDTDELTNAKPKDADNFLVCVFNVSSKVSYR